MFVSRDGSVLIFACVVISFITITTRSWWHQASLQYDVVLCREKFYKKLFVAEDRLFNDEIPRIVRDSVSSGIYKTVRAKVSVDSISVGCDVVFNNKNIGFVVSFSVIFNAKTFCCEKSFMWFSLGAYCLRNSLFLVV